MVIKKILAVAVAATMVVGSAVTAFAQEPVTSGGSNGTGSSEGHVNKHVISVTLPTIAAEATPFAYTMDPERLVTATSAAKYASGTTFTDDAKANGVYFLTGTNAYDSKSTELKVSSQSSADVKLSVSVEAEASGTTGKTDITLVDTAPVLTGDDADTEPKLYLALKVGDTTKAVKAGEKVTIDSTIEGKASNFDIVVKDGAYVYEAKTGTEESPITWNEETIQVSGVVSNASADGLSAPTLKVTWKYEDPAETPAAVFSAGTAAGSVKYTASKVTEVTSIMMTNQYGEFDAVHGVSGVYADATVATADGVTTLTFDSAFCDFYTGNVEATITFKDASGATQTEKLTLNMGE